MRVEEREEVGLAVVSQHIPRSQGWFIWHWACLAKWFAFRSPSPPPKESKYCWSFTAHFCKLYRNKRGVCGLCSVPIWLCRDCMFPSCPCQMVWYLPGDVWMAFATPAGITCRSLYKWTAIWGWISLKLCLPLVSQVMVLGWHWCSYMGSDAELCFYGSVWLTVAIISPSTLILIL